MNLLQFIDLEKSDIESIVKNACAFSEENSSVEGIKLKNAEEAKQVVIDHFVDLQKELYGLVKKNKITKAQALFEKQEIVT